MEDQLGKLMAQAQKLQSDLARLQEEMKNRTVEVAVEEGAVRVIATGNQSIKEIIIDPSFIHPANAKLLQSVIAEGVNQALEKAKRLEENEMKKITGGLSMPKIPGLI